MIGHFEAYRNRLEAYDKQFKQLAEKFKSLGLKVSTHNTTGFIKSIKLLDQNNNGVRIQFNEVPYRFSLEYDIQPSKEKGSGYTGKEFFGLEGFDFPFTVKDILKEFRPMYIDKRFLNYNKEL